MNELRRLARRALPMGLAALAILVAAGCSSLPGGMPPGTPIDKARHALFGPTEEFPLPNGGTRLEFPQGNQTFMLDFDAKGLLVTSQQVLTLANLGDVTPGMPESEVRLRYGRPIFAYGVARPKQHIWNYRYPQSDCFWYQISINDATRLVDSAGLGPDPICNGPSRGDR